MSTVAQTVGANVRRLRRTRGLTLVELGEHAGLAKGTLTQLEAGRGNPTIETMHALSVALGVALSDLVAEPPDSVPRVVRSDEGAPVAGWTMAGRLVQRSRTGNSILELYEMRLEPGALQRSPPHTPGVVEQLFVLSGTMEVGPEDGTVTLGPHDFVRFDADRAHRYAAPSGPATGLLLMVMPSYRIDARPASTALPAQAPPRAGTGTPTRAPRAAPPQIPVRGVRPPSRTTPGGAPGRRTTGP